jgi:hypothetical protein
VLALLVALVSVLAFALPIFRDLWVAKDSHLVGSFQGFRDSEVVFVVSNSGNRPGTVSGGGVMVAYATGDTAAIAFPLMASPLTPSSPTVRDEASFVDAGQSKLIKYHASPRQADRKTVFEDPRMAGAQCAMRIRLVNFSGSIEEPCFVSSCSDIARAIKWPIWTGVGILSFLGAIPLIAKLF